MASGDLPFFKFYPKEFLSSGKVSAMSAEAVGVYIRFLCMAWNETPPCTIPDDDRILAAWSTLGESGWQRVSCAVRACFTSAPEGRLLNARLLAEYNEARYQQKKKQNAGKAGADKRWQTHGSAMGVLCDRDSKQRVSEVRSQNETKDVGYAPTSAPTRRKPPVEAEPGWWGKSGAIQFNATERKWRGITPQDYEHWAAAYPAVDVHGEIRRAGEWCVSVGAKGRKSDYRKFINGWLSRSQDRGGGGSGGYRGGAGAAAGNAEQRRESRRASEFAEAVQTLPIA